MTIYDRKCYHFETIYSYCFHKQLRDFLAKNEHESIFRLLQQNPLMLTTAAQLAFVDFQAPFALSSLQGLLNILRSFYPLSCGTSLAAMCQSRTNNRVFIKNKLLIYKKILQHDITEATFHIDHKREPAALSRLTLIDTIIQEDKDILSYKKTILTHYTVWLREIIQHNNAKALSYLLKYGVNPDHLLSSK